jgi:hypothetical protein
LALLEYGNAEDNATEDRRCAESGNDDGSDHPDLLGWRTSGQARR